KRRSLPQQLEPELNGAGRTVSDVGLRCNLSEPRNTDCIVGALEMRVVEGVVHFHAEFGAEPLRNRRALREIHVPNIPPRLVQNVSAGITETRLSRSQRSLHELSGETTGIEPLVHRRVTGSTVTDSVGPLIQSTCSSQIPTRSNAERESGLEQR